MPTDLSFTGCAVEAILDAVGLQFGDLYPDQPLGHGLKGSETRLISARQGLEIVAKESLLISVIASDFSKSTVLSEKDRERLMLAAGRVCAVYAEVMR